MDRKRKFLLILLALSLIILPTSAIVLADYNLSGGMSGLNHPLPDKLRVYDVFDLTNITKISAYFWDSPPPLGEDGLYCYVSSTNATTVDMKIGADTLGHGLLQWSCDAGIGNLDSPGTVILTIFDFTNSTYMGAQTLDLIETTSPAPDIPLSHGSDDIPADLNHVEFGLDGGYSMGPQTHYIIEGYTPPPPPPTGVYLDLDVFDAISHNYISMATVGIQNSTSGVWTYRNAATGYARFDTTDGVLLLPLSIGQTVSVYASATGYTSANNTITIPYSGYTTQLNLLPSYAVNATGTFWLTVSVVKNEDGTPLNSAVVQVLSGGNSYQQYTVDNGVTTFQNISSGATFSVTAFAQAYAGQTKVLPKDADFMNTSFSLVHIGGTYATTPATPATTATVAVAYTNTAGQPISASEGQVYDFFASVAAELYGWGLMARAVVTITLLWMVVYAITGGKILDKLMRRGRGRGRWRH